MTYKPNKFRPSIIIKRVVFAITALLVFLAFPGPALVIVSADSGPQCNPVTPASTGTTKPTGSAAGTYTYNQCTGLYQNAHYIYNPATQTYSPIVPLVYACNKSTWTWQTTEWVYIASENQYVQQTVDVANPPAGSTNGTCTPPPAPTPDQTTQAISPTTQSSGSGGAAISGTNTNNANINNNTGVSLTNNINSNATSGNVNANQNTSAGNATSGNALASATIINSVNTSSNLTAQPVTFTENIDGNVNGDITIDPNQLQPSSVNLQNSNDVNVNTKTSGVINNNVNLSANSGNVNTSENTKVGDATSGSAQAMANVVNMLNSYISAGQSFIGTININGNLNGNILMPPTFLNSLAASGAPHTTVNLGNTNSTNINASNATQIINNINSNAKSGSVDQSENTTAGNATSGNASTSVVIYNLTGNQIIGSNGLLVFINVMGTWVGVIVNAPVGSHSALLGSGSITGNNNNTTNFSSSTNNSINNNITLAATSGNVSQNRNTEAGNATSGNASTSANVANLASDTIDFSGWFGILFINVFGNWHGNFGAMPTVMAAVTDNTGPSSSNGAANYNKTPVFSFQPKTTATTNLESATNNSDSSLPSDLSISLTSSNASKVMGDSTTHSLTQLPKNNDPRYKTSNDLSWVIAAGAIALAILLWLASGRNVKNTR